MIFQHKPNSRTSRTTYCILYADIFSIIQIIVGLISNVEKKMSWTINYLIQTLHGIPSSWKKLKSEIWFLTKDVLTILERHSSDSDDRRYLVIFAISKEDVSNEMIKTPKFSNYSHFYVFFVDFWNQLLHQRPFKCLPVINGSKAVSSSHHHQRG